ncbi:MAG: EAL domain-containing protein [Micavibrio aeruginosavorus]|uniref:EAL domain-containing protein n=1 Tax=Micavibrio aeruginosavorus TaxID=349221 RepID=A0A7T5R2R8_9BACT|nr:MAG: EAL domain-containing protein [Micavibrio aeruginosavorus]
MPNFRMQAFQELILISHVNLAQKTAAGLVDKDSAAGAFQLLEALRDGRFTFAIEPWHDATHKNGVQHYPAELLLRARLPDGTPIKPLTPITTLSRAGLQSTFDQAIILAGIDQALRLRQMPVSINTSARNMASASFWQDVSSMLCTYFPRHDIQNSLTFEVTEDDLADNPCRTVLLEMKERLGCSFAIDDFYHDRQIHLQQNDGVDSTDWQRLENLRGIIDFVKIDGETIEAAIQKKFDLDPLLKRIKEIVPDAHIITERVNDEHEAHYLGSVHGVDAVQGLHLTEDRTEFQRRLFGAINNFPPKPDNI